jgi:hypothetical protein
MSDTTPEPALATRLKTALKAHPVLRDEKKLKVVVVQGAVRLEGSVFTRDTHRQLLELLARLPAGNEVAVLVEAEVAAPRGDRTLVGQVPPVSRGAGGTKGNYSTAHLQSSPPKKSS